MSSPLLQCKLKVKKSRIHGYGVFADQDIPPEAVIEECYTLISSTTTPDWINYLFLVDEGYDAVPLGFGCIYNHARSPNAHYYYDKERSVTIFYANTVIKCGEEIFISYGKDWFSARKMVQKETFKYKWRKYWPYFKSSARFVMVVSALLLLISLIKP